MPNPMRTVLQHPQHPLRRADAQRRSAPGLRRATVDALHGDEGRRDTADSLPPSGAPEVAGFIQARVRTRPPCAAYFWKAGARGGRAPQSASHVLEELEETARLWLMAGPVTPCLGRHANHGPVRALRRRPDADPASRTDPADLDGPARRNPDGPCMQARAIAVPRGHAVDWTTTAAPERSNRIVDDAADPVRQRAPPSGWENRPDGGGAARPPQTVPGASARSIVAQVSKSCAPDRWRTCAPAGRPGNLQLAVEIAEGVDDHRSPRGSTMHSGSTGTIRCAISR